MPKIPSSFSSDAGDQKPGEPFTWRDMRSTAALIVFLIACTIVGGFIMNIIEEGWRAAFGF